MAKVICSASHPVDLSTGRSLAPGETAEDVDTDHPHQRTLVVDGLLHVIDGTTPRKRQAARLVDVAVDESTEKTKE